MKDCIELRRRENRNLCQIQLLVGRIWNLPFPTILRYDCEFKQRKQESCIPELHVPMYTAHLELSTQASNVNANLAVAAEHIGGCKVFD